MDIGLLQNNFHNLLICFVLDILLYLAYLKLSRVGGWVAGWVVGKSDFNENPVVGLDLDFGL